MAEFELKGPYKLIQKTEEFHELKDPDILRVTLNKTKVVRENKIKIKFSNCIISIYHAFNDKNYSGRWYSTNFPINKFKIKNNKLVVKHDNWENNDSKKITSMVITITLSQKVVNKIMKILEKCNL